eukprot:TRINITY_DN24848_c0_g1_i5.p2 TRINITY_DN24848_c0_g1~~TRINITY_DN24848_c0_g1_i5.p2  ORF type:complete len:106 (+),score=16.32 TRINITY_DN24848_c0_g1_i5:325-642(+)
MLIWTLERTRNQSVHKNRSLFCRSTETASPQILIANGEFDLGDNVFDWENSSRDLTLSCWIEGHESVILFSREFEHRNDMEWVVNVGYDAGFCNEFPFVIYAPLG